MDSQWAIEQLKEQQTKIAVLLCSASDLLVSRQSDDETALPALRWKLMRAMREYQLFKHRQVFDPIAATAEPRLADIAIGMKARCLEIGDVYTEHVRRWSDGSAVTAWDNYTTEARAVIRQIKAHLAREHAQAILLLNDMNQNHHMVTDHRRPLDKQIHTKFQILETR